MGSTKGKRQLTSRSADVVRVKLDCNLRGKSAFFRIHCTTTTPQNSGQQQATVQLERFRLLSYETNGKLVSEYVSEVKVGGGSEATTVSTSNSGFGLPNLEKKKEEKQTIHVTRLCA